MQSEGVTLEYRRRERNLVSLGVVDRPSPQRLQEDVGLHGQDATPILRAQSRSTSSLGTSACLHLERPHRLLSSAPACVRPDPHRASDATLGNDGCRHRPEGATTNDVQSVGPDPGDAGAGGPDRRRLLRSFAGTAVGAGVAASLVATARPAGAQTTGVPATLDQDQTFTGVQTFAKVAKFAQVVITSPSPPTVPLTIQLAAGQTADVLQVKDQAGATVVSLSARGDLKVNRLIARTGPWTGAFVPPVAFDSDPTMGWMPHPAGISAFSFVHKGREGFRLSHDGAVSQIIGLGSNRMMFLAAAGMVFASLSGHFELEGPGDKELQIIGYQVATPFGKTVVFTTDTLSPAVPLAVRGSGSVNMQEWRSEDDIVGMAIDKNRRLKFFPAAESPTATGGDKSLPAAPVGFFSVTDSAGVVRKIPYYGA